MTRASSPLLATSPGTTPAPLFHQRESHAGHRRVGRRQAWYRRVTGVALADQQRPNLLFEEVQLFILGFGSLRLHRSGQAEHDEARRHNAGQQRGDRFEFPFAVVPSTVHLIHPPNYSLAKSSTDPFRESNHCSTEIGFTNGRGLLKFVRSRPENQRVR